MSERGGTRRAATPSAGGCRCPRARGRPFTVFVNGVAQTEGADYNVRAGEIVFTRPIVKEKVGGRRWLAMYLGLFGTYRKHETVDIQFKRGGKVELVSDAEIRADRDH